MQNLDIQDFKKELHGLLLSCNDDAKQIAFTMLAGTRNAVLYNDFPIDHRLAFCALFEDFETEIAEGTPNVHEIKSLVFPFDLLETDPEKAEDLIKELHGITRTGLYIATACGVRYFGNINSVLTYRDWNILRCRPSGQTYLKISQ